MSPTPVNIMLVLLLYILLNVMDAKVAKTLLRMKNEKQEIVPHPVNGPGKILGHFMVAPNKIYREEKPGQEGYQYLTGWGHQGTPDPGCKGKAAGYIKNCQNKPIPLSQSCEEQLMAWQAECLMGKYIGRRRRRILDNFLRRNA
jgi:hypothetical protein